MEIKKGYKIKINQKTGKALISGQGPEIYLLDLKTKNIIKKMKIDANIIYYIDFHNDNYVIGTSEGKLIYLDQKL